MNLYLAIDPLTLVDRRIVLLSIESVMVFDYSGLTGRKVMYWADTANI